MPVFRQLLSEMRRRRVFRTTGLYIVGAWVVLQVADLAFESWGMPDTALRSVWIASFMLFPVALLFGWRYDISSKGIVRTPDEASADAAPLRPLDYGIIATLLATVVAGTWFLVATLPESALDALDAHPQSIAVLPFEPRSAAEDTTFFADGVHDDLLTTLANISDLKVISRTSVLEYRGTTKNVRQIGRELGAAHLLEGAVQQVADNVRINVQLINAQSDEHVWAKIYDRKLSIHNLFAIQSEIAETIAEQLAAKLSPEERSRISRDRTDNLDAFNAYIKGKNLFVRSTFESLRAAEKEFLGAIEIDPDYVLARVALARTYSMLADTGAETKEHMLDMGHTHIDHAIKLDPGNGYALAVLAKYQFASGEADFENTFGSALELSPNSVDVLDIYASFLRLQNKNKEVLPYIRRALELDPLSTSLFHDLGRANVALGRFDDAYVAFHRIAQIDPENPQATHGAALATIMSGRLADAGHWSDKAAEADPLDFENPATSAYVYLSAGDVETARARMLEALELGPEEPYPLAAQAYFLTVTGDREQAVSVARAALARNVEDRWLSHFVLLRTIREEATATGNYDEALAWYRQLAPELFDATPAVDTTNVGKAVDLAHLLQKTGETESAARLLQQAIAHYDEAYASGSANYPLGIAKVEALALLGRGDEAIAELRRVVDDGWRMRWRWDTEHNRNLDSIRDDPEFTAIVTSIEEDLAEQARQLAANGGIPSIDG